MLIQTLSIITLIFGLALPHASASELVDTSRSAVPSTADQKSGSCNVLPTERNCACDDNFADTFAKASRTEGYGKPSGGLCLTGVRVALQHACKSNGGSWGCEAAANSGACFAKMKFEKHLGSEKPPTTPPPGTVFVYEGGDWGRIEVYTGKIRHGEVDQYCSDFCTEVPMYIHSPQKRKLVSWWVPPEKSKCN